MLFAFDPAATRLYPVCVFHAVTGLYCPGCGSLRALHQLLHGHVATALGYNCLLVLSVPVLAYALASHVLRRLGWRSLPVMRLRAWLGWVVFAVIVAFGVLRNIPGWPFNLLAP
jgi:sulfite exporter TauE/SafE